MAEQKVAAAISARTGIIGACSTSPLSYLDFRIRKGPRTGNWKMENRNSKMENPGPAWWRAFSIFHFAVSIFEIPLPGFKQCPTNGGFLAMFFALNKVFCPRNAVVRDPQEALTPLFSTESSVGSVQIESFQTFLSVLCCPQAEFATHAHAGGAR
jgi:hypothetical protein